MSKKIHLIDRMFGWFYLTFRNTLGGPVSALTNVKSLAGAPGLTPPKDYEAEAALYSNRYRGAFIINFALGFVAVALALVPLSGILPEAWLHALAIPLGIAEISCIAVIMLIHWYGRDAGTYETARSIWLRKHGIVNINQGWRERWGHARLAAEHLRFSELMVCFPGAKLDAEGILESAGPRYSPTASALRSLFEHCPVAQRDAAYVAAYRDHFISVMAHQGGYHHNNAHRYHRIAHRLHSLASACFYLTLAVCAAHLFVHHPGLSALAALLPALGATCHGILAAGEFHKLSEQSQEMCSALAALESDVRKTPTALLPVLERQVRSFFALVTRDAVGWHLTLLGKDVQVA